MKHRVELERLGKGGGGYPGASSRDGNRDGLSWELPSLWAWFPAALGQ